MRLVQKRVTRRNGLIQTSCKSSFLQTQSHHQRTHLPKRIKRVLLIHPKPAAELVSRCTCGSSSSSNEACEPNSLFCCLSRNKLLAQKSSSRHHGTTPPLSIVTAPAHHFSRGDKCLDESCSGNRNMQHALVHIRHAVYRQQATRNDTYTNVMTASCTSHAIADAAASMHAQTLLQSAPRS